LTVSLDPVPDACFLIRSQVLHAGFALMTLDHIGGFMPMLFVASTTTGFFAAAAAHLDKAGPQEAGLVEQLVELGDRVSFTGRQMTSRFQRVGCHEMTVAYCNIRYKRKNILARECEFALGNRKEGDRRLEGRATEKLRNYWEEGRLYASRLWNFLALA
jgi:hypothetical protein